MNATGPRRLRAVTHLDVSPRADRGRGEDARAGRREGPRVRRGATTAVVLALAAACGAPDRGAVYVRDFDAAEKAETTPGASRTRRASTTRPRPARRSRATPRTLATSRRARSRGRATPPTRAVKLHAIAAANPPLEDSAEAAYAIAELRLARGDEAGWPALYDVATRFPSSGVARRALVRAVKHDDDAIGARATPREARGARAAPRSAPSSPRPRGTRSRSTSTALGDVTAARDALLALAARFPYPRGAYWDDALWRASEIDE